MSRIQGNIPRDIQRNAATSTPVRATGLEQSATSDSSTSGPATPGRVAEVADRFERAAARHERLIAGNVVGPAAALLLNVAALCTGVTNSLVGIDPSRGLPQRPVQRTESVRRGLGGV